MTDSILKEIFDRDFTESPVMFDVNPLVLSVRLKKIKETDPTQWFRLDDPTLKARLMGEDFNEAEEIKDYYSKKLMWESLKNSRQSDYRTNLMQFLQHPKSMLTKREVGMVVTLPYFYEEDKVLDSITSQYQVTNCPEARPNLGRVTRELKFIQTTSRWTNKVKYIYYWFVDDNQYVYSIQLEENNSLRKFFEDVVLTKSKPIFDMHITKVSYPFEYYKMFDYKLVK